MNKSSLKFYISSIKPKQKINMNDLLEEGFTLVNSINKIYKMSWGNSLVTLNNKSIPCILNPFKQSKILNIKLVNYNFIQKNNNPIIKIVLCIIHNKSKIGTNYTNNSTNRISYYGINNINDPIINSKLDNIKTDFDNDINFFEESIITNTRMYYIDLNINEYLNIPVNIKNDEDKEFILQENDSIGIYVKSEYLNDRNGNSLPIEISVLLEEYNKI